MKRTSAQRGSAGAGSGRGTDEPIREQEIDALIERIRRGESGAFARLMEELKPFVSGSSFRVCRDREIADENVQDTFVNVYRKLHQFDGSSKFTTWLYSIVVNNCRMKRRRRLIDQATVSTSEIDEETIDRAQAKRSAGYDADHPVLLEELQAILEKAVDDLPDDFRIVLTLRDMEERSTEETARTLGISEAAVKSRLHRARAQVRRRIESYLNGDA